MTQRRKAFSSRLLLGGLVLLALLGLGGVLLFSGRGATRAEVYMDGALVETIDLRFVPQPYALDLGEGNRLEVEQGRVRMVWADCPDQVCVNQSWSSSPSRPIVCLPNKVTVLLVGKPGEVDGVLG